MLLSNMKNIRSEIRTTAIILTLVSIAVSWYFNRSQVEQSSVSGEASTITHPRTKTAERAAPDTTQKRRRHESISLAAQKWYEELLEKYPQMKPTFRDVADEQNGFLQFLLFAESLKAPRLPENLNNMFRDVSTWDASKFKEWLADNKDYCDQIVYIAELPAQSAKGIDFGRVFHGCANISSECGNILSASSRLAFEAGDLESALRYSKASINLSNHFANIEVPSMLGGVIAETIRMKTQDSFVENILPGLANNPQALASWREALFQREGYASEFHRLLSGEWNVSIRTSILPALLGEDPTPLGEVSLQIPDLHAFFDAYTSANQKLASSFSDLGQDRLIISHRELEFAESGIDPKALKVLKDAASSYQGVLRAWGAQATRTAMISAALAVQLGEVPPVDPVSGKPFGWDPNSRTLSPPDGVDGFDPIKLR